MGLVCCVAIVGLFLMWWFHGSGLSEETAYKLANEYAEIYAKRNRLNLNLYTPPLVGAQGGRRLYEFTWTPNQGGKPLTIGVDRITVEVSADESPEDIQESIAK